MPEVGDFLAAALACHQSGRFTEAERLYREILEREPRHAEALHLLGVLAASAGESDLAVVLLGRAIEIGGPQAVYCCNLGAALSRQGKWSAAAACYLQAIEAQPRYVEAWWKLARALAAQGLADNALGAAEQAFGMEKSPARASFEYASVLALAGRTAEAEHQYREVLAREPRHVAARFNLAVMLMRRNRLAEAAECYRQAIAVEPGYAEAHNNLGIVLQALGDRSGAQAAYAEALARAPDYSAARFNLWSLYHEEGRFEQARDGFEDLLSREPWNIEAANNLGNALLALGQPLQALAAYARVLAIDPDHAEARWNDGLGRLLLGDYEAGWEGYEWRFRQKDALPPRFKEPLWDGRPLNGRSILLHAEQGLGDTIQFVRYAPMVRARGGTVLLECQPALEQLLTGAPGVDGLFARGAPLPAFDCQAPLLSLPRIFGTRLESIPPPAVLEARRVAEWRSWLSGMCPASTRYKVGLTWAGNPGHKNDRRRSMPLAALAPLGSVERVAFFCLQKGPQAAEAAPPGLALVRLDERLADFSDTAAAIAGLDLVISVDTAVAHLAGTLGRPVWLLLPYVPDWRWMLDRDDSPWYPSIRLFRQPAPDAWGEVVEQARKELSALGG